MKQIIGLVLLLCGISAWGGYKTELHVAQDGSGDFSSIQAAIDGTKAFPELPITIFIKNGVYAEKVKVHAWNNNLTLKGESADGVVIQFGDFF